jgi:hypothetical protein
VVENGIAFVRLDQRAGERERGKSVVARLAARKIQTLPTVYESEWYDDKGVQSGVLKTYSPETLYTKNRSEAEAFLDRLPIMSKSIEGAGSKNVRLLSARTKVIHELNQVFGRGLAISGGKKQRGYVLWQKFIEKNDCDYRVCIIGNYFFGLIRQNRPDRPMASGSGINEPISELSEKCMAVFRKAAEIASDINTRFMAFDFVFQGNNPLVLEMSSSWTPHAYAHCPVWELKADFRKTKYTGGHMFDLLLEILC